MVVELSARELAYVTARVGTHRMPDGVPAGVAVAAYEILKEAVLSDIQATGYLHEFENIFPKEY